MVESNTALGRSPSRDHHPKPYSMWLAGGIKPVLTYRYAGCDFRLTAVFGNVIKELLA
jgi:hypothetical protein